MVNETRFQYLGEGTTQTAQAGLPTISVLAAFTGGGSNQGNSHDTQNHYELQNYTSIALESHYLKFGVRLRDVTDSSNTTSGFNGFFTFPTLAALAAGRPTQFKLTSGLPSAYVNTFDAGLYIQDDWRMRSNITLSYGLRFETQTRISDHADFAPRLGFAWGLGAKGKGSPKTVIRAGWGIFYDRFASNSILQAERENGVTQQVFTVTDPTLLAQIYSQYPNLPSPATLQADEAQGSKPVVPVVYQIAPNLRAPMLMQTAVSLERQLNKAVNLSVSYLNSRGSRQLLTNNINAPVLPGTQTPASPASGGLYPNGIAEAIHQFQSKGIFRQSQLVVNATIRSGARLMLNAYYSLNYANTDTGGVNSFPSDPYNLLLDYGRAAFAVRHRAFFGGTVALPKGFRLSPFMVASSGTPYNITLGQDLIGSTIFNQRPAFASSLSNPANVVVTPLGSFDTVPQPGETLVPMNYLTGPGQFSLNLRLSKTFTFGPAPEGTPGRQGGPPGGGGGPGPRGGGGIGRGPGGPGGFGGPRGGPGGGGPAGIGRYSFTISANARNIFNDVNLATPIGNLDSPLFGKSNALASGGGPGGGPGGGGGGAGGGGIGGNSANRSIYLQLTFGF
jgi:hypothetical protein